MLTRKQILNCSSQAYVSLLSLYPNRFSARFGGEMLQIFRDCHSREEGLRLFYFWMRTLKDLAFSLPREWRRETLKADGQLDYTGLADLFMITIVAGTHLIGWGVAGSAFAVKSLSAATGLFKYSHSTANVLLGLMTLPMAALIGIVCALIVARLSRVECNRITA